MADQEDRVNECLTANIMGELGPLNVPYNAGIFLYSTSVGICHGANSVPPGSD